MNKIIDGILVTSSDQRRGQILYDSQTGLILDVGDLGFTREKVDYYFNDDCLLFAGMGDIHVHAREDVSGKENYKEDYGSAGQAALAGGVTYCLDMPNNPIAPIDDESYRSKVELTKKGQVPIFLYAGLGPNTRPLSHFVPYKVYMGPSIGSLFFQNARKLEEVLSYYRNQWVSFHCEDPEILEECRGATTHLGRRPSRAETTATQTALEFIAKFDLHGKLCHYSAGEGLHHIRTAKQSGVQVSCEVTPQHLYFSDEMIQRLPEERRVYFQMNPPIRSERERELLLDAFLAGDIDFLATDHAPHSLKEKKQGISGLPGLDTYGAFVTWAICKQGACPKLMAKMCSENPGRFVNRFLSSFTELRGDPQKAFGKGFGFLKKGYTASFTILNLSKSYLVREDCLQTKAKCSPFMGVEFPGRVEGVFIQGQLLT